MPVSILLGSPEIPVRASFAHVFKPSKLPGQADTELRYSIQALVPKSDPGFIPAYQAAIQQAYEEAVANPKAWKGVRPDWSQIFMPIRDGDDPTVNKGKAEYMGHWVVSAKTKPEYPPEIFNQSHVRLTSDAEFYSGCYCMVAGALVGYEFAGKKGITLMLNGALFIKDGEKFSGVESAESAFSGFMKPAGFNALAVPGQNPMIPQVPGYAPAAVPPPMPNMQPPVQPGFNPMAVPPAPVPQYAPPVNPMAQPFVGGPVPPPFQQ